MENEISKKDTEIVVSNEKRVDYFANNENFTLIQRMAKMLSQSTIIPKDYRGSENISNCIIALEIASRLNLSPMVVMQNLYIINSRPS